MNKDDELFEEYDDEPTRRWEGAAPRRLEQPRSTNSSFLGYNNGTIRRPPLLETEEKYLTNDDLDALQEDFEDVSSPRKDIKLPGMATTPGSHPTNRPISSNPLPFLWAQLLLHAPVLERGRDPTALVPPYARD